MTEKLTKYNQKRNFSRTAEPEGKIVKPQKKMRFVIQHHMARRDHYDFRLEWEGTLLSWAVPKGPSYNTKHKRLAVHVEDHPLDYRNFEGTIPKGEYGGGTVMLWDEGTWEPQFDAEEGMKTGSLKIILYGKRLKGKWALVRMKPKENETDDNWLLLKEKDEYTKDSDGISNFITSIRTGRTMEEIAKGKTKKAAKNPFQEAEAQLAKLVDAVPKGDWLYELKYDGYRILAFIENSQARLVTRNNNDYTEHFASVAATLADFAGGRAMVLDGEMVIADAEGKTDFQALQNYMKGPRNQTLTYIVFDLLALDGKDLRMLPLIERKQQLEALMKGAPSNLRYSKHIEGTGEECFAAACNIGMEGIVGKKINSIYSGSRNGDWIKLKCEKRQEFVIGGYTISEKKARAVSSLLLGVYDGKEFIYVGRSGTGLGQAEIRELDQKFKPLKIKESPFHIAPKPRGQETIIWLNPKLVAEIKFAEWTDEDQLRQASFKGLRMDKDPKDVKRE